MAPDPVARLLAGIDQPLMPRPEFAEALLDRLLGELEHEADRGRGPGVRSQQDPMIDATAPLSATAVPASPWPSVGRPAWPDARGRRDRALAQLATAALVVFTLVGGFLAFGPGRPGQHQNPAVIPALSETPATPQTVAAPVAEFLWQSDGGPNFPLGQPSIPAIDPQGNIWVADGAKSRFVIFSPEGVVLEAWGTPGSGEGDFAFECSAGMWFGGVAFDATGNIYVADAGNQRIQKFGPDHTFLTSWGSKGTADEQFLCPAALAVDRQGRVYVSDEGWGKIKVFAGDGTWLATWSGVATPIGIAVDGDGSVWVADFGGSVVKFSAEGDRLAAWKDAGTGDGALLYPKSVAVDAQGRVFVTDFDGHRILVFAPDGTSLGVWGERGTAAGQFQGPHGIALDGKDGVYVTEYSGKRLQKFRLLPPLAAGTPTP